MKLISFLFFFLAFQLKMFGQIEENDETIKCYKDNCLFHYSGDGQYSCKKNSFKAVSISQRGASNQSNQIDKPHGSQIKKKPTQPTSIGSCVNGETVIKEEWCWSNPDKSKKIISLSISFHLPVGRKINLTFFQGSNNDKFIFNFERSAIKTFKLDQQSFSTSDGFEMKEAMTNPLYTFKFDFNVQKCFITAENGQIKDNTELNFQKDFQHFSKIKSFNIKPDNPNTDQCHISINNIEILFDKTAQKLVNNTSNSQNKSETKYLESESRIYALYIHNDNYVSKSFKNLNGPRKDAKEIDNLFSNSLGHKYKSKIISDLNSNSFKIDSLFVENDLKEMNESDIIIVHYGGHGFSHNQKTYWAPTDFNFEIIPSSFYKAAISKNANDKKAKDIEIENHLKNKAINPIEIQSNLNTLVSDKNTN